MDVLTHSERAKKIVAQYFGLTAGAKGRTGRSDCSFLLTLIERIKPAHIVEVGVASGTSSLLILRLIEAMSLQTKLSSFDCAGRYYEDPTKELGFLVHDHFPDAKWDLHSRTVTADVACRVSNDIDFVYIDANHLHPWPALDVLLCAGFCKPET